MSERFSGRILLVTGAASGIGEAFARLAAAEGAAGLVLLDLDGGRLEALAGDLPCPALALAGDVGDAALWERVEGEIRARFGRLDHALANAGIGHARAIVVGGQNVLAGRVIHSQHAIKRRTCAQRVDIETQLLTTGRPA